MNLWKLLIGSAKSLWFIEDPKPRPGWVNLGLFLSRTIIAGFALYALAFVLGIFVRRYHYYYIEAPAPVINAIAPGLVLGAFAFATGVGVRMLSAFAAVSLVTSLASGDAEVGNWVGLGLFAILAMFGPGEWVIWNIKGVRRPKSPSPGEK